MPTLNDLTFDDIFAAFEAECTGEIIEDVIAFDYKTAWINFPPLFIMDKKCLANGLRSTDLQARVIAFNAAVMPRLLTTEKEFNALLDTLMNLVLNPKPMYYTKSHNRFDIENGKAKKYTIPANQVQILANTFRNTLLNIDC